MRRDSSVLARITSSPRKGPTHRTRILTAALLASVLAAPLVAHAAPVPAFGQQYLRCFRDEGGNLHEVVEKMPETPPPTIWVQPPTTTTTLPQMNFNYTPQVHCVVACCDGEWGPMSSLDQCNETSSMFRNNCPKPRVLGPSLEWIRAFRQSCGNDNGMSCHCEARYH
jgi:hypothetical protein